MRSQETKLRITAVALIERLTVYMEGISHYENEGMDDKTRENIEWNLVNHFRRFIVLILPYTISEKIRRLKEIIDIHIEEDYPQLPMDEYKFDEIYRYLKYAQARCDEVNEREVDDTITLIIETMLSDKVKIELVKELESAQRTMVEREAQEERAENKKTDFEEKKETSGKQLSLFEYIDVIEDLKRKYNELNDRVKQLERSNHTECDRIEEPEKNKEHEEEKPQLRKKAPSRPKTKTQKRVLDMGVSQNELAEHLGVSASTISRMFESDEHNYLLMATARKIVKGRKT